MPAKLVCNSVTWLTSWQNSASVGWLSVLVIKLASRASRPGMAVALVVMGWFLGVQFDRFSSLATQAQSSRVAAFDCIKPVGWSMMAAVRGQRMGGAMAEPGLRRIRCLAGFGLVGVLSISVLGMPGALAAKADKPPPPRLFFSPRGAFKQALSAELMRATKSIGVAIYGIDPAFTRPVKPRKPRKPRSKSQATLARYEKNLAGYDRAKGRYDKALARFREKVKAGSLSVIEALSLAVDAGVRVQVVLNDATGKPNEVNALLAAGVELYATGKTMHHKFAVVDRRVVVNGSGNFTPGAFYRYNENWLIVEDVGLAKSFTAEMKRLVKDARRLKEPLRDDSE